MRIVYAIMVLILSLGVSRASEVMPWISKTGIDGIEVESYYSYVSKSIRVHQYDDSYIFNYDFAVSPLIAKVSIRPDLGFSPYLKVGILSSEIKDINSSWSGGYNGSVLGIGFNKVLGVDSSAMYQIVTDAGLNYYYSEYDSLSKWFGSWTKFNSNSIVNILELRCSLLINKEFKLKNSGFQITPYGGANISLNNGSWHFIDENITLRVLSGNVYPVIGIEMGSSRAALKLEYIFLSASGISIGLSFDIGIY